MSVDTSILSLKVWVGRFISCISEAVTLRAVSEVAQKKVRDLHHLIWIQLGTNIWVSSILFTGVVCGKKYQKSQSSSSLTPNLQDPSFVSIFEKING